MEDAPPKSQVVRTGVPIGAILSLKFRT